MPSSFPILIAFLILFLPVPVAGFEPPGDPGAICAAAFLSVAGPYLFGLLAYASVRVAMARPATPPAGFIFGKIRAIMALYKLLIILSFFLLCNFFAWREFVNVDISNLPAAGTLLQILPFMASLGLFWMILHAIEAALGHRRGSPAVHLLFNLRHAIPPLAAICLLTGTQTFLTQSKRLNDLGLRYNGVKEITILGATMAIFLLFPLLVRAVWPVTPIPAGELRRILTHMAASERVRLRNILCWKTGASRVMNACMVGVIRPLRYILMTDALIEDLSIDEVRAVFGHELCHAKRNHVLFYALFIMSLFLLLAVAGEGIGVIVVAASLAFWAILFGWISRRFERECDLFGARAAGSLHAFATALHKISPPAGGLRRVQTFLHASVPTRVGFLLRAEAHPQTADRFAAGVKILRATIVLLFIASFLLAMTYGRWSNG